MPSEPSKKQIREATVKANTRFRRRTRNSGAAEDPDLLPAPASPAPPAPPGETEGQPAQANCKHTHHPHPTSSPNSYPAPTLEPHSARGKHTAPLMPRPSTYAKAAVTAPPPHTTPGTAASIHAPRLAPPAVDHPSLPFPRSGVGFITAWEALDDNAMSDDPSPSSLPLSPYGPLAEETGMIVDPAHEVQLRTPTPPLEDHSSTPSHIGDSPDAGALTCQVSTRGVQEPGAKTGARRANLARIIKEHMQEPLLSPLPSAPSRNALPSAADHRSLSRLRISMSRGP
ncbi:hypothetical protein OE88DRAFT_1644326 [Heliocybe sulcata]|uniref:Uncharacterized protein n=1 Tax=Heliocybe sulcata TaxID=5364 RepID=A0A5C3N2K8_9AGAM|nr:hypothetical protein OE88DRAFT_1644326 [Heliocybe sulcata]